jgi:hypothetical protein
MAKNRTKTNLVHKIGKEIHEVSKEKSTGKFFIKNTTTEIPPNKLSRKYQSSQNYNFDKPYQAQDLGDEWSDYAWSADDF